MKMQRRTWKICLVVGSSSSNSSNGSNNNNNDDNDYLDCFL